MLQKIFFFLSIMADDFAEYNILDWQSPSFRTWNALLQALLAFKVPFEKLAVITMVFFFICDLCIFSWSFQYTTCVIYTLICCEDSLVLLFGALYASCFRTNVSFFLFGGVFFYGLVEDLVYAIDLGFFSLVHNSKVWVFLIYLLWGVSFFLWFGLVSCTSCMCGFCFVFIWFFMSLAYAILSHSFISLSFEIPSWATGLFNLIFISAWVHFNISISLLNYCLCLCHFHPGNFSMASVSAGLVGFKEKILAWSFILLVSLWWHRLNTGQHGKSVYRARRCMLHYLYPLIFWWTLVWFP